MRFWAFFVLVLFGASAVAFADAIAVPGDDSSSKNSTDTKMTKTKEIYFAGGCFWGTEHFLKKIRGVTETDVGYANGNGENPNYRNVSAGKTGFAETVKVKYDSSRISLERLLDLFYKTIDPTSINRQGNDRGTQYRTGIYYTNNADEPIVRASLARLAEHYSRPIAVECAMLRNYYSAEDYHQDYLDKHPGGYCHIPKSLFKLAEEANPEQSSETTKYMRADDAQLKKKLSSMQYAVTRKNATEPPFRNEYWNEFREGIYVDVTTGEPLFVSTDKFESGCGWPSFSKPISRSLVVEKTDRSHGMIRTEVRSKTGDAHLGHVFLDGPGDKGGMRYCINSAALLFVPKEEMEERGYGDYLSLLEK